MVRSIDDATMTPLLLTMFMLTSAVSPTTGPADLTREVTVDGVKRAYMVHLPPSYDIDTPMPLVLVFHGGGSNPRQTVMFTGLDEKADREGFITLYPSGTGRVDEMLTWNAGNCCGKAMWDNVDDVKFVSAILDAMEREFRHDAKRVFATGISNGGMIAYRLAAELSERIAAIAPVAGPMGMSECKPKRPVPVLHFHGTRDEFAPFEGGRGKRSLTKTQFNSAQFSIDRWVKANDCSTTPVIDVMPNHADDGMTVTRYTYGSGRDGAEVVLVKIEGGGHTWPGRESRAQFLGPSTRDISANDLMWEFFKRHPMK